MKKNIVITAGVVLGLTATCLTPFAVSANTERSSFPSVSIASTTEETTSEYDFGKLFSLFGKGLGNFGFSDTEDALPEDGSDKIFEGAFVPEDETNKVFEGALVPEDAGIDFDYGDLTDEEIKELHQIFDRYEKIFAEVLTDEDVSEEEIGKKLLKYQDEIEKLDSRATELMKKAGWDMDLEGYLGLEGLDFTDKIDILNGLNDLDLGFDEAACDSFIEKITKSLNIDPNLTLEDVTTDQVVDIVGGIVENIDADDLGSIFTGLDSDVIDETLNEMKTIVRSDDFRNAAGFILDMAGSLIDEY